MPKRTKFPVVRKDWPRLIDYRSTKLRSYMLDARKHGGKREYFVDLAEAKSRADELATTLINRGTKWDEGDAEAEPPTNRLAGSFSIRIADVKVGQSAGGTTIKTITQHVFQSWRSLILLGDHLVPLG